MRSHRETLLPRKRNKGENCTPASGSGRAMNDPCNKLPKPATHYLFNTRDSRETVNVTSSQPLCVSQTPTIQTQTETTAQSDGPSCVARKPSRSSARWGGSTRCFSCAFVGGLCREHCRTHTRKHTRTRMQGNCCVTQPEGSRKRSRC